MNTSKMCGKKTGGKRDYFAGKTIYFVVWNINNLHVPILVAILFSRASIWIQLIININITIFFTIE